MTQLNEREWRAFSITDILGKSHNSKAYHATALHESAGEGIPYITRTAQNNGLFSVVENNGFSLNPRGSISLGAENAKYFFQPYPYITGNKMYYYFNERFSSYVCLFLVQCLNKSIEDCGFGYGMGLTGTRSDTRTIMLPVNACGDPDYPFMETYIRERIENKKAEAAQRLAQMQISAGETTMLQLKDRAWKAFTFKELFIVRRGESLYKQYMESGTIPYISASGTNNGISAYTKRANRHGNMLSLAYDGSVGAAFYQATDWFASEKVVSIELIDRPFTRELALFFARVIEHQKTKYNYGYKWSVGIRMMRGKILIPVDDAEQPDYAFMEQYIREHEAAQTAAYLAYLTKASAERTETNK